MNAMSERDAKLIAYCVMHLDVSPRPSVKAFPALSWYEDECARMNARRINQAFNIAEFLVIEKGLKVAELQRDWPFDVAALLSKKGVARDGYKGNVTKYTRTLSITDLNRLRGRLAALPPSERAGALYRQPGTVAPRDYHKHGLTLTAGEWDWIFTLIERHDPTYRRPGRPGSLSQPDRNLSPGRYHGRALLRLLKATFRREAEAL